MTESSSGAGGSLSYDFSTKPKLKTIVISVIDERFDWSDQPYKLTNSTEGWAYALKGSFRGKIVPQMEELARYDLVLANLDRALIPTYARLIETRPRNLKWVSTIEGCGTDYLQPSPELLRVFDASDLVVNINKHTTPYLQSLTKTKVAWIGVPYPADDIRAFSTPRSQRRNEVLICPRKNANPSLIVAGSLGMPVSTFVETVSRKIRNAPLFWRHRYYGKDLNVKLWGEAPSPVPRIPVLEGGLEKIWTTGGGCRLWINLDPRFTWARWVLDAAALGVPVISTRSTAHSAELFPETTVEDIFSVDHAMELAKNLVEDEDFAMRVTEQAWNRIGPFRPQACVQRLGDALGMDLAGLL